MHEVSVASEILQIVSENAKESNIKKVDKIILQVGEFTCIEDSLLQFAFEAMKEKGICENAQLFIKKIKATSYCDNCKEEFEVSYRNRLCPKCNNFGCNIVKGYELYLESIEGE
ncbi:hydrogenase maturation nickel metallochaperone HypA [Clostridium sp. BSD9I1]|uniref:hydrogenase maturation nickel metallochaperone HypA n=1 Tax=Clostridium sp. BSD9I1 TaxID=2003589 RepID=UPI0016454EE9|nr:hydrogenase maturation nickel metallochaperone HypA [Clostridium sp. BSD9I1]